MKNVIGHPARGTDFYPRERVVKKILRSLGADNHLQLAAPRRVGKTSILMHLLDTKQTSDHFFVYVDVEATTSENNFYKKLYESVIKSEALTKTGKMFKQIKDGGNTFLKRIKAISLIDGSIELNSGVDLDFYNELKLLLKGLNFGDKRLVLLIDEFPYAINNLIEDESNEKALNLLKSKRELRQDPVLLTKVQFVYTGSISLNTTVENISASELVNDIDSITVSPLIDKEAKELINKLIETDSLVIGDDELDYILQKVVWLIPFHIQLLVKELFDISDEQNINVVTREIIDKAFLEIVDFRNNNYFEHYLSRLKKLYKGNQYNYAIEILHLASKNDSIIRSQVFNLASKHEVEDESRRIIHNLIYDGYLFQSDTNDYSFNSPILKMWWKKYV
ncbi:ATP-binding protein [Roseivirga sp. E12]|uniref:ATP-binding protein n=1 Tax=Roseivirga sp. E12 TaxID=2819237 RepID=UPI001ABC8C7F|nr:ATP-binding protein [Roseivirga sp. E12]MBO3697301.1 ATP-binding protein [Roseivirga sp. E12]